MARLKLHKALRYDPDSGRLQKIFCKNCGVEIASQQGQRFLRNGLYAEASILLKGNARHVTHGCRVCLNSALSPNVLKAMYLQDLKALGEVVYKSNRSRVPICVGVVSTDGNGII